MKKISKMKSTKLGSSASANGGLPLGTGACLTNGKAKGMLASSTNGSIQDESNLKVIRDLSHLDSNRYCFDCGQRGPMYVNVTIGSFVCMSCSGLLRGLTPPHRVKSISMASFSPEEIELLKSHGNEYCRKVWLGTYTGKEAVPSSGDPDRLNAIKSHLSVKYEQKRYYVDPGRLTKSELSEIQDRNLKALTLGHPSPSSTHSNPSPLLNNLRSRASITSTTSNGPMNGGGFPILHDKGKPRLSNSVTLPDMKPLSTLVDPSHATLNADLSTLSISSTSSTSSASSTPRQQVNGLHQPINFINNLVNHNTLGPITSNGLHTAATGTHSSSSKSLKNGNSDYFQLLTPWESSGEQDGFNSNFADFEDAFKNEGNGLNNCSSLTANGAISHQKLSNGGMIPMEQPHVSVMSGMQHNGFHSASMSNGFMTTNSSTLVPNAMSEDKYAALKDLDSLFKQGNVEGLGSSPPQTSAITTSVSVPANLSSSFTKTDNWFSTTNQQNPFSSSNGNGWTGTPNGFNNNNTSLINGCGPSPTPFTNEASLARQPTNPHNPFFGNSTLSPLSHQSNGIGCGYGTIQSMSPHPIPIQGLSNPFFGGCTLKNPNNPFL